jgi:hypothetical protein
LAMVLSVHQCTASVLLFVYFWPWYCLSID